MKSKSLFNITDVEHIGQKRTLFESQNKQGFDKSKENLLIVTKNPHSEYSHLFGFITDVIKVIENHFNIIYIAADKDVYNVPNYYRFNFSYYKEINENKFKRKAEQDDNVEFNKCILYEEFKKSFDFTIDKVLFVEDMWHMLPMTSYVSKKENPDLNRRLNEFHDYVGNDKNKIKEIEKHVKHINENFDDKVSILAFSMFRTNMMLNLIKFFHEKQAIKMLYTFNIDPATWLNFFEFNNIPNTKFYFENDKRGTRDFVKFPIAQMEHVIFEPKKLGKVESHEKIKDFFFIGTVLKQKGDRIKVWETFLRDLRLDNSVMYIPEIANIIYKNKKSENSAVTQKKGEQARELFADTIKEMHNNPMWVGHILPADIPNEIAKYKYGFIARCVSFEDSLNFRPILYSYHDVLPFIDFRYDPEYLQIPKEIQERLICYDHKDIEKWTKFYNENEEERQVLLHDLRNHFQITEFEKNWKEIIKSFFIT